MSSSESDAASSLPSSPLSNSSAAGQTSALSSPEKCIRSYGRVYRKVRYSPSSRNDVPVIAEAVADSAAHFNISEEGSSDSSSSKSEIDSTSSTNNSSISSSKVSSESDISCVTSDASECSDSENERGTNAPQKLFIGSNKTRDEAIVALMDLYINRRWKSTTLKETLEFCNTFFPSKLPRSVHKLFAYVESYAPDNYKEICHYYCADCVSPKKERKDQCQECDSTFTGVFFEFPLSSQIKQLFEQHNLASLIDSYKNQVCNDRNISDITTSEAFRKLKTEVNGKYDITLLFNCDGVSPVKSSNAHLYPILATICELPPNLRARHLIVCGIWYDLKFAPVMNHYFTPFVNALTEIYEKGVVWTHPSTNQEFKSIVTAPVMSADALARADILDTQHHNSKRGCNNCEIKTKRFKPEEGGKKIRRYLFQEEPAQLRDHNRMNAQGKKAAAEGVPVKGVVGNAVVAKIPYFDRAKSAPPEYMHCVLLGVVKQFLNLWLNTAGDWNIKSKMGNIDAFITKNVKVTDQFVRIPKRLKDVKLWKASDLRVWLLFLSLPALHGHLKEKYFQHWMLLVGGIYLLLKQEITANDLLMAKAEIRIFVRDIAKLYRLKDYTYNVHNLLHLTEHVKRWGPLWATSAFTFESFNHVLSDLSHGPKHKGKQIVNRIRLATGLEILRNKISQCQEKTDPENVILLVKPVVINLDVTNLNLPHDVEGYLRANVKGEIFTTQQYDEKVKRANSYIQFKTTQSFAYGQILFFYKKNLEVNCLIRKFKVQQRDIFAHVQGKFSIMHLIPIYESGIILCTSAKAIVTKLAKVGNFLCIRPNAIEKNL